MNVHDIILARGEQTNWRKSYANRSIPGRLKPYNGRDTSADPFHPWPGLKIGVEKTTANQPPLNMRPDFVIVGAMKAGTSTLAHHLRQHPQIYMPEGELHFFSAQSKHSQRKERTVDWYEKQFEGAAPSDLCGEKTPTYSYLPSVPKSMHQIVPDAKLLWILRDPVDRAYSNYWHAVCAGAEWLSFEEAVRRENERIKQNIWKGYVRRSRYVEQIDRFLEYFNREAMHFCVLKNFKAAPESTLKDVCTFLGVDREEVGLQVNERQKNATVAPRSILARYVRCTLDDFPIVGSLLHKLEFKYNRQEQPGYPEMPSEVRARLKSHFSAYNKQLEKRIGIDVGEWKG